jgi:Zn ribbon nucleic-acid-binding protein
MRQTGTLSVDSKSLCTSQKCPNCGALDRVTAERVFVGEQSVTRCHCRTCGHSWMPAATAETGLAGS